MNRNYVPSKFKSFHELRFCGNTLVNVRLPLLVYGQVPVLIGKRRNTLNSWIPQVWLNYVSRGTSGDSFPLVRRNEALHEGIDVTVINRTVIVKFESQKVIEIRTIGADCAEVSSLDLRPFGLDITGTNSSLKIGTSSFANNRINNAEVMFSIGDEEPIPDTESRMNEETASMAP